MRCASLCIGVVAYEHPAYGGSSRRLQYAVSDAAAFSAYLRTAFPDNPGEDVQVLLTDGQARKDDAEQAVRRMASSAEEIELFILYLAGHGDPGHGAGGWFCLADAVPGTPSLNGPALDTLLALVPARKLLVIVDCCHAEAVIAGSSTFSRPSEHEAKLYIASARASQYAWEVDDLRRSVLSDVMLRGCARESTIQDSSGRVLVDSALFGWLREQVPLVASAQKDGAIQEPVVGGTSRSEICLYTVDVKSFGRSLTIAETVRKRSRQILMNGVMAAALLVLLSHVLVYHLAVLSDGRILVRTGTPLTYSLLPSIFLNDIDTGFRTSDVRQSDAQAIQALANAKLWGFALHQDAQGVRQWFAELMPKLRNDTRLRAAALILGTEPGVLHEDTPAPLDQALFIAALHSRPIEVAASSMYGVSRWDAIECQPVPGVHTLDFNFLLVPTAAFTRDLYWQALLVPRTTAQARMDLERLLTAAAYRARGLPNKDGFEAGPEWNGWTLVLGVLRRDTLRSDGEHIPYLQGLLGTRCFAHAAIAIARLGSELAAFDAENMLITKLAAPSQDQKTGMPSVTQELAVGALVQIARVRQLGPATVRALVAKQLEEAPTLDKHTLPSQVLSEVAQTQSLGEDMQAHLFRTMEDPEPRDADKDLSRVKTTEQARLLEATGELAEYGQLTALLWLARQSTYLTEEQQLRVRRWIEGNLKSLSALSIVHESIGWLLAAQSDGVLRWKDDALIAVLISQLSPETYFPSPATGYRGELAINASGDAAMLAIARIGARHRLPIDLSERLARFAVGRRDIAERQIVLDALARQWHWRTDHAQVFRSRLREARGQQSLRQLEVEVACSAISVQSDVDRRGAVRALIETWNQETEPELRHAIALLAARLQWPRIGSTTGCSYDP